MCKQNGYWKTKRKLFRKNKFKKVWQPTTCLCGAESTWSGIDKMLDAGMTPERIQEAFRKIIRDAR